MEQTYVLELEEKQKIEQGAISLKFLPNKEFKWIAGQALIMKLPHVDMDDRGDERTFSIASAPSEGFVMIATRDYKDSASTFKKALFDLEIGDTVEVTGPIYSKGNFQAKDPTKDYIFLVGGIGITPVRSIMKEYELTHQELKGILLYANRTEEYIFGRELDDIAENFHQFKIAPYYSKRIDPHVLRDLQILYPRGIYEISGPPVFIDEMLKFLKEVGVPDTNIFSSAFKGGYTQI